MEAPEKKAAPEAAPADATEKEKMEQRLKTAIGKKIYGKREETVEPVFGIIKQAMGFRQFLLRGLEKANTEWKLVTLAACALGNPLREAHGNAATGGLSLAFSQKKAFSDKALTTECAARSMTGARARSVRAPPNERTRKGVYATNRSWRGASKSHCSEDGISAPRVGLPPI